MTRLAPFALVAALGGISCLPADTRPPPGSVLLLVSSADEPTTVTADGWSITIDRLLLGIGDASLGYNCKAYSESSYRRLLDGRRTTDQKLAVLYGSGRCYFEFKVTWPTSDALLGEGVTEMDREIMAAPEMPLPGERPEGVAVDFAATAWRGSEIKHLHWTFNQGTRYLSCMHKNPDDPHAPSESLDLSSGANYSFHVGVRGAALFGNDFDPKKAELRFDPVAAADTTFGNADGEITLDELGDVPIEFAQQYGPYVGGDDLRGMPHTLEDYLFLVLRPSIITFRENIGCDAIVGL